MHGKIVRTIDINTDTIKKINTTELTAGLYILQIKVENGTQTSHKLVIN
jgi:hypothetical protein